MFRLLALLQLTRAALAFTAVADAWTVLLLRAPGTPPDSVPFMILKMTVLSLVSVGLYGFGMALNDLLDSRHDRLFAPRRPIPSGRIAPRTAVLVALTLLLLSLFAAAVLGALTQEWFNWPFIFAFATAAFIVFYDGAAKYLGGIGLVTLGATRSLHCLIGNPKTPILFLSMVLLAHVFLISLLAYRLENKRPRLRRFDLAVAFAAFIGANTAAIFYMYHRGTFQIPGVFNQLWGPAIAMLLFALWTFWLLLRANLSSRQKGERLMLMGLFWLFAYDASILMANEQPLAAAAVALLLLCAIASFFAIRAMSRRANQPRLQFRPDRPQAEPSATQ